MCHTVTKQSTWLTDNLADLHSVNTVGNKLSSESTNCLQ